MAQALQLTQQENSRRYAAFAFSNQAKEYAFAYGMPNQSEVEKNALQSCRNLGVSDCKILAWFSNAFGAIARADDRTTGWAYSNSRGEAEQAALQNCRRGSTKPDTCKVIFSKSASD
jgi:hypothetical protein